MSDDFDFYIKHRDMLDCVDYCDHLDQTFKEEVDLNKHMEKRCKHCGKEFSVVNSNKNLGLQGIKLSRLCSVLFTSNLYLL